MSTLLQELVQVDPAIAVDSVAEFRATLVAISNRMQEESSSSGNSLQAWWQWLEDEGYDGANFAAVLSKIGTARLGDQAFAALLSFCRTSEATADGIPHLLEHLHSHHPQLAAELETLEDLALVEEEQLLSTAGGMSKGGRDALIGVAAVAGGALVGVGGYKLGSRLHRAYREWAQGRGERVRAEAQATGERGEEKLNAELKSDFRELEQRGERSGAAALQEAREHPGQAINEAKALRAIDPQVYLNQKNIVHYTTDDIEDRAETLLAQHIMSFPKSIAKHVESRVERDVRNSPEYQQKLKEYAESSERYDEEFLLDVTPLDGQKLEQKLAPEFEKGDWFKTAVHDIWQSKGTPYRAEVTRDLTTRYRDLVSQEVTAAKDAAKKDADNEFYKMVGGIEEDFIRSEVRVTEDVLSTAEGAVKQAEREGEAILRDSEDLI